jgi:pimeloyl-ACP methyl ester carboxylesterase
MQNIHTITSNDKTLISFQQSGTGHPLLFVHGTSTDHNSWSQVSPRLEDHFSVYAMDRRGRGASGDSSDYALLREVEDLVAVVEAIGAPVALVGHSFGGLLSLEAALLTDKITHLILYEPAIPLDSLPYPPDVPNQIQTLLDRAELELAMELFLRQVANLTEQELAEYRQSWLWNLRIPIALTIPRELAVVENYIFNGEKFSGLKVPTMFLLGSESPPFARKGVEIVAAALPNSQIVSLPGQQHVAHLTNPDLFARTVERFLLK